MDAATIANLSRAVGLEAMPDTGLVVGRVLDSQRRPVAGATVSTSNGDVAVMTPNAALTGLTADGRTGDAGWFVLDAGGFDAAGYRCCTEIVATHSLAGEGVTRPLGLLDGLVLGTTIELRQPAQP